MIKIEIPDISVVKTEYLNILRTPVRNRIEPLIKSLQHLNGISIDTTDSNFDRYKHVTRKIIHHFILGDKPDESLFNLATYKSTVQDFINNGQKNTDYAAINFSGLIQFLEFLINPNTNELDKLLVCDPTHLITINDSFLTKYSIAGDINRYVLSRAFNYEEYNADISILIKSFYRERNFVKFCPYCNLTEVEFFSNETGSGGAATSNELDHFFDKAHFPLLSYSFFNIVPSDGTCNGSSNKGSILFTDKYHSNPYAEGFEKSMVFKPKMIGTRVDKIEIDILVDSTDPIFSRMLGREGEIKETLREGNINVFSIYSKYSRRIDRAEDVLSTIYRKDKGKRALTKIWNEMDGIDNVQHHKTWYKQDIKTYFDEVKFHEYAYSKFNRDIHDFYYRNDSSAMNEYIRLMMR